MTEIYYIGGSPCSGKSTVAEMLVERYGLRYYKLDDYLEAHLKAAAADGKPHCTAELAMDLEQTWMRPPSVQCEEELAVYEEMLPYARADLAALGDGGAIVAEGAGFLPALMQGQGVDAAHYLCIVPTEAFQREKYAGRPWIGLFLEGCSEPDTAFDNWMGRDALFAVEARRQAEEFGYDAITVDGGRSPEDICAQVAARFGLSGA